MYTIKGPNDAIARIMLTVREVVTWANISKEKRRLYQSRMPSEGASRYILYIDCKSLPISLLNDYRFIIGVFNDDYKVEMSQGWVVFEDNMGECMVLNNNIQHEIIDKVYMDIMDIINRM